MPHCSARLTEREVADVREMTIEAPMRAAFWIMSELIRPVVTKILLCI